LVLEGSEIDEPEEERREDGAPRGELSAGEREEPRRRGERRQQVGPADGRHAPTEDELREREDREYAGRLHVPGVAIGHRTVQPAVADVGEHRVVWMERVE